VAPKHGLGKGLSALLPVDDETLDQEFGTKAFPETMNPGAFSKGGIPETLVSLEKLRPNPSQPRTYFEPGSLQDLAASIREHGIIQPIIAEDAGDGTYIIVAGERRTRAAALAGLSDVPVIIRAFTDEQRMEISLIENIQRTDLNPIEEATAYRHLMEVTGLSQEEVAAKVGKNRSTVTNALRLLKLPPLMQKNLEIGQLSPGHARALLSVSDPTCQEKLFQKILVSGISVREAEKFAAACNRGSEEASKDPAKTKSFSKRPPELSAIEEKFIEILGTKVIIDGDLNRGSIRIDYYSMNDLDRIYEILER
jgi:ParB family chromosome partitioning protein